MAAQIDSGSDNEVMDTEEEPLLLDSELPEFKMEASRFLRQLQSGTSWALLCGLVVPTNLADTEGCGATAIGPWYALSWVQKLMNEVSWTATCVPFAPLSPYASHRTEQVIRSKISCRSYDCF